MPGQYVVGVVSSVASAPESVQDAFVQAQQAGSIQAFQRTLDPGAGLSSLGGLRRGNLVLSPGPTGAAASLATTLTPGPDDETLFVSPSIFYPTAAILGQAEVITIGSGVERSNVDFRLRAVPSLTVSGIVTGPEGPSSGTLLQLLPSDAEALTRETGFETATAVSDAAGAFTFVGVTPGAYTIRVIRVPPRPEASIASSFTSIVQVGSSTIFSSTGPSVLPPLPNGPTYWASVPVSVTDRNLSGVFVTLRTGGRLTGHLEFIGAAEPPPATSYRQFSVAIDGSDGRSPGSSAAVASLGRGQINANGELETYQLPAGKYIVRGVGSLPGWTFAGAWLEGQDISATPFEMRGTDVGNIILRFTDKPPELAGTVRAEAGATDVTATVLLFPADRRAWTDYGTTSRRFRSTETAPGGTFTFTGMAEGDYNVVAIRDGLPAEWQDPVYLQKIAPVATRVTISANDRKIQDLRVSVVR
jgi:hypothetical protein